MRKLFLLMAFCLCSGLMTCVAQENLVNNPSFEDGLGTNGLPAGGWWKYDAKGPLKVELDQKTFFRGGASVRFSAGEAVKSVLVSAPFEVAPGDELRFLAHVRGEGASTNLNATYAGIAFRRADGNIFQRAYFKSGALGGDWSLIIGDATAPAGTVKAEVHLGYTNTPASLWFDDVSAIITSPVSFSLVEGAKPWAGKQEIVLRVANHQTNTFRGTITGVVARKFNSMPVVLEPNTSRDLKFPIQLNGVGAHAYKFNLLNEAENSLRVVEGKFQIPMPLVLFPPCPCYQVVNEGNGDTRIDARVNADPAQIPGMKLAVEISDASGKQIDQAEAKFSSQRLAGMNVHVPVNVPGVFDVKARLLDASGKEIASAKSDIHVDPPGEAQVKIVAPSGFLEVAGKPNFPIGLYSCEKYEELGQAGFTATHDYSITLGEADEAINPRDPQVKELLDRSWSNNGMRMMVELPRKAIEKARWDQVRRRIETFRHHPGLLCWGSEERVARGTAPLANIEALYKLVHELDPDHPLVLGDTRDVIQKFKDDRRDFFPDSCMDAGIWWWYPIPIVKGEGNYMLGAEKAGGLMEPPSWLTTTHSKKPLWIAIQSYQKPAKDARFPTPEEYRCQAYLAIINGVKGLFFYTGTGQKDYQGKPAGLLNKPELAHWDYVKQLVHELREVSPIVMASSPAGKFTVSPPNAPVEFAGRELDGKMYLLAANKSDHPQRVSFTGPALQGRKAHVLYENHPAAIEGDSLSDDFIPFGVHVYQFDP